MALPWWQHHKHCLWYYYYYHHYYPAHFSSVQLYFMFCCHWPGLSAMYQTTSHKCLQLELFYRLDAFADTVSDHVNQVCLFEEWCNKWFTVWFSLSLCADNARIFVARTRLQRPGFKTSSWRQVNSLSHDSDDDDEDDDDDDYGHIGDVMLVWRKGNINRTVSVLQYCVPL